MISFLCDPMNLFYIFKKIILRRGPHSSPDSQGLKGTKKVGKTTSSFPHPWGARRLPGLLEEADPPWRAQCGKQVPSSPPGSFREENQFLLGGGRGLGPSLLFSFSSPPKVRRIISLLKYQDSSLFLGWLWTCFESFWAPRSAHTGRELCSSGAGFTEGDGRWGHAAA